jgi:hypothetical protein
MISTDTLVALTAAVRLDGSVAGLRSQFPALHFTECSEDDISHRAKPVADVGDYCLFLVSGASGHCLELTSDSDTATGVVVAAKVNDQ